MYSVDIITNGCSSRVFQLTGRFLSSQVFLNLFICWKLRKAVNCCTCLGILLHKKKKLVGNKTISDAKSPQQTFGPQWVISSSPTAKPPKQPPTSLLSTSWSWQFSEFLSLTFHSDSAKLTSDPATLSCCRGRAKWFVSWPTQVDFSPVKLADCQLFSSFSFLSPLLAPRKVVHNSLSQGEGEDYQRCNPTRPVSPCAHVQLSRIQR